MRTKNFAFHYPHAGFDTKPFGFNRRRQNTAAGSCIGSNSDGFAAQMWVSLLLDCGKAGVKVDVQPGWRRRVESVFY